MQRHQLNNKGATIMSYTHQTAPTQFVEANGIRFLRAEPSYFAAAAHPIINIGFVR